MRLRQPAGLCAGVDRGTGRTIRRYARHRELNFLPKAEGRLPIQTIGLRLRYEFASQKPDHLPGYDIF